MAKPAVFRVQDHDKENDLLKVCKKVCTDQGPHTGIRERWGHGSLGHTLLPRNGQGSYDDPAGSSHLL
jgi:hypothetical protein